jgi:hypothetical protein
VVVAQFVAEQTVTVGERAIIEAHSPCSHYLVVFEDDGTTGYLYGLDTTSEDNPIVDALHIYNVTVWIGHQQRSRFRLGWSRDGLKAILTIDGHPHAIFDFESKCGYCRSGYPSIKQWSARGHEWDDAAIDLFE